MCLRKNTEILCEREHRGVFIGFFRFYRFQVAEIAFINHAVVRSDRHSAGGVFVLP